MGLVLSRLRKLFEELGNSEARVLMLGLDAAGKTTVLYKIKLNETVVTIPTIGFNVETVQPVKGLTLTVWDVGGQSRIRPLWRAYCQNCEGLIYVIDSADRERLEEAREELFAILESDEMRGVPVIVIANKQDLPGALSAPEVVAQMCLQKLFARQWYVQSSCATTGEGIYDAMSQLALMVKKFKHDKR